MWKVKTKVMPVIAEVTGTNSKSLRQYLCNIPGKDEINGIKKSSHTGHSTHTSESSNVRVQNIFHGRSNITCSTNCIYRRAATLYTLATWFVSGI